MGVDQEERSSDYGKIVSWFNQKAIPRAPENERRRRVSQEPSYAALTLFQVTTNSMIT